MLALGSSRPRPTAARPPARRSSRRGSPRGGPAARSGRRGPRVVLSEADPVSGPRILRVLGSDIAGRTSGDRRHSRLPLGGRSVRRRHGRPGGGSRPASEDVWPTGSVRSSRLGAVPWLRRSALRGLRWGRGGGSAVAERRSERRPARRVGGRRGGLRASQAASVPEIGGRHTAGARPVRARLPAGAASDGVSGRADGLVLSNSAGGLHRRTSFRTRVCTLAVRTAGLPERLRLERRPGRGTGVATGLFPRAAQRVLTSTDL